MTAAESQAAVERLAHIRKDQGAEDFAAYAFLVLGLLGWQQPEVLHFLLDQADKKLEAS